MPYTVADMRGDKAREFATRKQPFGLNINPEQAKNIERIHHIGSSFTDPGGDWNRFDIYDAAGKLIGQHQEDGY